MRSTLIWDGGSQTGEAPGAPEADIPNLFDEPPTAVAPAAPPAPPPAVRDTTMSLDVSFDEGAPDDAPPLMFDLDPGPAPTIEAPALDLDLSADLGIGSTAVLPSSPPAAGGLDDGPRDEASLQFLSDPTGERNLPTEGEHAAPAPKAEEGLEVLNFIDESAPEQAPAAGNAREKRYMVRKPGGKTFGPYDESTVVQMLREGKLLGNEEVSTDGDSWAVISSVPLMAAVIEELMSATGSLAVPGGDETSGAKRDSDAARRLQELYGGRMASAAIVESVDHVANLKKRLPLVIAGAVVAVIAAIGIWLGFTPYGFFGEYKIVGPPHVSRSGAAAKLLDQARAELTKDTYASYGKALDEAGQARKLDHRAVEPPAVQAQAVFYLQRRFDANPPGASAARDELEKLEVVGEKEPDVVKARAGLDAVLGESASARPALEALVKKSPKDTEALYLLAETWFAQDKSRAATYLRQLLAIDPKSAKALHALGYLATLKGDLPEALAEYRKALAADPDHASSAVEADYLQSRMDGTYEGVDADLRKLAGTKGALSPAEASQVWALLGQADAARHDPKQAEAEFKQAVALDPDATAAKAAYGRFLLEQRRLDEALPLVQHAFAAHPRDPDIADALARVQLGLGHYLDAVKIVTEALAQHPSDSHLMTVQGLADVALGKPDEAGRELLSAIRADPTNEEAHVSLGRLLLARGALDQAKVELQAAVAKAPKSSRAHAGLGDYLLAVKDAEGAKKEFDIALQLDPLNAAAHHGLGRVRVLTGDQAGAEAELREAQRLDAHQAGLDLTLGTLLWKEGKLAEAEKELGAAAEADLQDPNPPGRLGAVLFAEGKVDPAIQSLNRSIAISSKLDYPHYYYALALLKKGNNQHALQEAKTAVEAAPDSADDWYAQGLADEAVGAYDDASKAFGKALQLRPAFPDAEQELGSVQAQLGNDDDAVAAYAKAMALDPARARLAISIGDLQAKDRRYKQAIASYRTALEKDPKLVQAYYLIGRSLDELGQSKEAAKLYRQAIASDPKNPLPYRYLGYYYKGTGETKKAIESFQKYLQLKPDADDKDTVSEEVGFLKQG